jgi:phospholipid/cholesterol/gamma-HCH transport system substrate-binding protein/paraquat-inducible protein B
MDEKRHYFRLGLFVVVAAVLGFLGLLVLAGPGFFQKKVIVETYFTESVSGLEVGSPVKFRGVPIGRVSQILLSTQAYPGNTGADGVRGALVVVRAELSASGVDLAPGSVGTYVRDGLRAQTQLAGITGSLFLSFDFVDPAKYPAAPFAFSWTPDHPYVPSAPSATNQIIQNAQNFLANLDEADIKALVSNIASLADSTDKRVRELDVASINAAVAGLRSALVRVDKQLANAPVDRTLAEIGAAARRLEAVFADPKIGSAVGDLAATSARLRQLAESGELDRALRNLEQLSARTDAVVGANQFEVTALIEELNASALNLRSVTESLRSNPSSLFFGAPPPIVTLPRQEKK